MCFFIIIIYSFSIQINQSTNWKQHIQIFFFSLFFSCTKFFCFHLLNMHHTEPNTEQKQKTWARKNPRGWWNVLYFLILFCHLNNLCMHRWLLLLLCRLMPDEDEEEKRRTKRKRLIKYILGLFYISCYSLGFFVIAVLLSLIKKKIRSNISNRYTHACTPIEWKTHTHTHT